jgi:hypothetical protein
MQRTAKCSTQGSNARRIEQQAALIEDLTAQVAELRRQFELVCKHALGPMLVRTNRMERAIKPRLVVSN